MHGAEIKSGHWASQAPFWHHMGAPQFQRGHRLRKTISHACQASVHMCPLCCQGLGWTLPEPLPSLDAGLRMTVIRLPDGSLFAHSAVAPTGEMMAGSTPKLSPTPLFQSSRPSAALKALHCPRERQSKSAWWVDVGDVGC